MADSSTTATSQEVLPDRTVQDANGETGPAAPSKNALKKAAKDKEKVPSCAPGCTKTAKLTIAQADKAAARKAAEAAQKQASEANDVSQNDYGELPPLNDTKTSEKVQRASLAEIATKYNDTTPFDEASGPSIVFRAVVNNARNQSAKLSFLMLSQGSATIQAVVAASDSLSRQMVKFCGSVPSESVVLVHAIVKKPHEPVKSASISHLEVHVKKLFVESKAYNQLPMQVADAERPLPVEGEEPVGEDGQHIPIVTLNTRLNYRVIDLRASHNQAIFKIKHGVTALFQEYLQSLGFIGVQSPKLLGAASEGGANVFKVNYFERDAFLAQSPQLYKQMLIAARMGKVYEVGPVFRAENSNTARHLTEFTGLDFEMEFQEHYHEVVQVIENLMLHIFNGLRTRFKAETDLIRSIYHVEEFKLPQAGNVVRLPFSEGIKMLRDDGLEINDFDDLR